MSLALMELVALRLDNPVNVVVVSRAEKQMIWIAALGIITTVTDELSFGYFPVMDLIANAMR